jgi:hypothetical protein
MTEAERAELMELARLVKWNIPSAKRPDEFHQVKSDIEHRLRRLARHPEAQ